MLPRLFAPRRRANQAIGYQSHVNVFSGDAAYDTTAEVAALVEAGTATNTFNKIWEKTIPAQQAIRWGYGSAVAQRNQGYMYWAALDAGVGFEEGILRLVQANARETDVRTVIEIDSTRLHTTTATSATTATPLDINQMLALPEQVQFPLVGEDSLLQLWFRTTSPTTTVDVVTFSIPVTIYQ